MATSNPSPNFSSRPTTTIEKKYFVGAFNANDFTHHFFIDTGAKRIEFTDVDFSFSTFTHAYFRNCSFVNCKFIGARFVDSNFHGSEFQNCTFDYSLYTNSEVPYSELLKNLSGRPNVDRAWLKRLRINAQSLGETKAVKAIVKEEIIASREHLRKAREGKEGYYASKYQGLGKQVSIYMKSISNFIDWHVWGHGEYPSKLVVAVFCLLLLSATGLLLVDPEVSINSRFLSLIYTFFDHFTRTSYAFIGVIPENYPLGLAAFLSLMRYISLGLFISVLYKSIARR